MEIIEKMNKKKQLVLKKHKKTKNRMKLARQAVFAGDEAKGRKKKRLFSQDKAFEVTLGSSRTSQ